MAVIAKGNASIIINPEETGAKLLFVPAEDGLGWDADAVIKLAGENRLSPPPAPSILEPFLQKAARAKHPLELVLYEGFPSEAPEGERVTWEELPVPGDIAPFAEEALAGAGEPELYRIKVERVKRETIVKKPNKLPFLPPREEVVTLWDKKETQEAVRVNPVPGETRYAEKNKKLGTILPPKPGKPGRNVFGRPIPPPQTGDGSFLLGRGLFREKNEIRARYAGIIRIGENWADVVPLAKPSWSAAPGSDGVTLFFQFEPGDPRFPPPSAAEILAGITETEDLIGPDELDAVIQNSIRTGEAVTAFPLFKTREAEARVVISPDYLRAELFLRKGIAGARPLEMKAVSQAIKDSKVRGFDAAKLRAEVQAFMQGKDLEMSFLLVEGAPAARGQDREITPLAPPLPEEEREELLPRLKSLPRGSVSFPLESLTAAARVEKGAKIARLGASGPGKSGVDVFGNVLPGLPGNDPELKLFQGLHLRGADILADAAGLVLIKASEKCFWGEVIEYRDAVIRVELSEDAMEARAALWKERGAGKPLKREGILKALTDAGAVKGVDLKAVDAALSRAQARGSAEAVLARGETPVAAGGTAVRWLTPPPLSGQRLAVIRGQVLAELIRSAEARAGFDVTGKALEGAAAPELKHDDSIGESPVEGGRRLSAARSGDLRFNGGVLGVSALYSVKGDVGPATGNINFSGEVRIAGKVQPGFTVMGGGNVLIGGSVHGALISAGGKAVIAQGIAGGGKGAVRARNTIEASSAEQAALMAVEDIKIITGCVRCDVKTNGKLAVIGETGRLAGGVYKARRGVDAFEVGAEQRIRTEISFGQDYLVKDQIEAAERDIEKIKAALLGVGKQIKEAERIPSSLEAARAGKVRLLKQLEQANLRVFTLREKFEEHFESEVRVRGAAHPGVVMESHGRYYEVTQKRSRVVFYFDRESGRIKDRPLE
jgi:uncharacterized protein (DUF342 family)